MNNIEKDIYLEVLRAALWERTVDLTFFKGEWRWLVLLESYRKHDLLGVVANTLILLPEEVKPSMQEMMLVYNYLGSLLRSHHKLNTRLAEVMPRLQSAGCKPVLLKGQGLSVLYPKTCVRACGDLDIYVGEEMISQAKAVINSMATPEEVSAAEDSSHHYHINVDGIIYELHHIVGEAGNKRYEKEFKLIASQYFSANKEASVQLPLSTEEITQINVPSLDFNIWYILDHLVVHVREAGVGYRQFCDWLMVVRKYNETATEEDNRRLKETLRNIGLLRAWQILGGILVYQLGLPAEEFPLYDERKAKKSQGFLIDDMLDGAPFRFAPLEDMKGKSRIGLKHFLYNLHFYYYISRPRYVISPLAPYFNCLKFLWGGFTHSIRMVFE